MRRKLSYGSLGPNPQLSLIMVFSSGEKNAQDDLIIDDVKVNLLRSSFNNLIKLIASKPAPPLLYTITTT